MSAQPIDSLEAFLREARTIAFLAADHGTHRLYERLKGMLDARHPALDWRRREQIVSELARLSGV